MKKDRKARGDFSSEDFLAESARLIREDLPETKEAIDRLIVEGHSREQAKTMIARALAVEMRAMFTEDHSFNQERLLRNLKALPEEPKP